MLTFEQTTILMNNRHESEKNVLWYTYDNVTEWIFIYGPYVDSMDYFIYRMVFSVNKETAEEKLVFFEPEKKYNFKKMEMVYSRKITLEEAKKLINASYFNCDPSFDPKIEAIYENDDSFYFLINERLFGENKFYVSIDKKSCSEKKLSHEEAREIRPNRFKAIELDK